MRSTSVAFVARAPHFYLEPGESIHPSLTPAFRGQWEGSLQVLAAGDYEFRPAITLNGVAGTRHTVTAGLHALTIPFTRAPGPAQLRFEWRSGRFDWEPVPRAALSHQLAAEPPDLENGRRQIAEARCANCHPAQGMERATPKLDGIGSRTNTRWLHAFLQRHHGSDAAPDLAA